MMQNHSGASGSLRDSAKDGDERNGGDGSAILQSGGCPARARLFAPQIFRAQWMTFCFGCAREAARPSGRRRCCRRRRRRRGG